MKPTVNCQVCVRWPSARAALAATLAALVWLCTVPSSVRAAESELPRIDFGEGERQIARSGVAAAAIAELLDAPRLLAGSDGRRFVFDGLACLANVAPAEALNDRFESVRQNFKPHDGRFDRARALVAYGELVKGILDALPPARRRLFLVGDLAQSIAYNARVLREADADRFRGKLAGIDDADASAPGLAELRGQLGRLEPDDWNAGARLATRAVAAILGSAQAVPFPSSPSIWTVLVRSRIPAGRDAAHEALDVVWFDGHHQVFAAYPEGGDFSKNADRLVCMRDREPPFGSVQASPLVMPPGHDYDALASSFERSCDAFDARPPPYVVADAGDDRFIAAMLSAAGLDPKRALGQGR